MPGLVREPTHLITLLRQLPTSAITCAGLAFYQGKRHGRSLGSRPRSIVVCSVTRGSEGASSHVVALRIARDEHAASQAGCAPPRSIGPGAVGTNRMVREALRLGLEFSCAFW